MNSPCNAPENTKMSFEAKFPQFFKQFFIFPSKNSSLALENTILLDITHKNIIHQSVNPKNIITANNNNYNGHHSAIIKYYSVYFFDALFTFCA